MVLLVKLKNPNRKVSPSNTLSSLVNAESPAAESESSSQEYKSAAESSIVDKVDSDDALDDLANALGRTQIDAVEGKGKVGDEKLEETGTHSIAAMPAVDVLIAPAVLGHRWVRTRSNAFVVERPERVRAVSLGIAAVLAKHQSQEEPSQHQLDSLSSHLASLSVDSTTRARSNPLAVFLSQKSLSLAHPNAALKMIHALEDEYLSLEDVGLPSAYSAGNSTSTSSQPIPYTSFLDKLCSQAPHEVPPPPAPRSVRYGLSPAKVEDEGCAKPASESHPSEIPPHLSQGDLYLCGSREEKRRASYFASADQPASDITESTSVTTELPQTPRANDAELMVRDEAGEEPWLKGGSRGAIEAALGTCCTAVDRVVCASRDTELVEDSFIDRIDISQLSQASATYTNDDGDKAPREPALRSFVLVRPPGHHCNSTQPSGFCWVNNVAVMAAHAYHQHGIDRVAILDFDLHHGNGTQSIAWRINADTVRLDLEREAKNKAMRVELERKSRKGRRSGGASGEASQPEDVGEEESNKRGLKVFYGSLHDIESYPCEDGNKELITDASMCIEGAHGQWIWNIHLDAQNSPEDSQRIYDAKYSVLLQKARQFFEKTSSTPDNSLVLISAGFDANTHEQVGMQRHGKNVPPRFYEVFTRDAVAVADEYCKGKCISVLEGGYSDRALTSGAIAHLAGLGATGISEDLYQPSSLYQLEKVAKTAFTQQPRRKQQDALSKDSAWLEYVLEAFRRLEEACGKIRISSLEGTTAPVTPNRSMMDQLWKSPRETRSSGRPVAR